MSMRKDGVPEFVIKALYCSGSMFYDTNWMTPYFLSFQETGFEMKMLNDFDVELLIGQISYKQKSDIYNISKGYDTTRKTCTTMEAKQKRPLHMHIKKMQCCHIKGLTMECTVCHVKQNNNICSGVYSDTTSEITSVVISLMVSLHHCTTI